MPSVFLAHPSSLEHDTGGHPEQAARITAIDRELSGRGWLGFERVQSPAVSREVLTAVHPEAYVASIERACAAGRRYLDLDTLVSPGSFEAALHAAGGAMRMVELLVSGEAWRAFSAHRPPGHHATRTRAMGFCLFNNVAVAARYALDRLGVARVMILDWDVHHGNGTNDIFHESDRVLFVSIHQSPLYPGTGPASDAGSGAGEGFTVNLPVPPGSDDTVFTSLVDQVAVPLAEAFSPQLMLISAGYDAHSEDPLADCRVTEEGYGAMARSVSRVCSSLEVPLGCVLEGGYALAALAQSVVATLEALVADPRPAGSDGAGPSAPIARSARERLARWWPALA
jgi:acetoin utilization deacetylase AcuC-like enzyme